MRLFIISNLILAVLCASLAICSNILKRPSSPLPQISWKKRLLNNYSQESKSPQNNSLSLVVSVNSLQSKESDSSLAIETFTNISIAEIRRLPENENGTNLMNSTPNSIVKLFSDNASEESFALGKNSTTHFENLSQLRKFKDCMNDAVGLSVLTQAKPVSSSQSVSMDYKLRLRIGENSKDASNSIIKENSSIIDGQQLVKTKLNQLNRISFLLNSTYGTLSWSIADVKSMKFTTSFHFNGGSSCRLHFGSDNLINLFFFKYSANMFNLFSKNKRVLNEEYRLKAIESIHALISTSTSLPTHIVPYYYSFSKWCNDNSRRALDFTRVPLFFLFTTISYFLKNDQNEITQYLTPLLKQAYQKALDGCKFRTGKWIFLKNFLSQYFDISDLNFNTNIKSDGTHLDISIVSFIYHEMKFGSSGKVQSFFNQVWEASKRICDRKDLIIISESPKIFISSKAEIRLNIFEREARKLYQIEFTNILFKQWNRFEELLDEFSQLRLHFSAIILNFRLKIFNSDDFESLNNSLRHIYSLLKRFSFQKKSLARSFLVELEYFINFKCFLFIFDFCHELKDNNINGSRYQKTFQAIESILESYERIRSIGSNHFELNPINFDILRADSTIPWLSLEKLTDKCLQIIKPITPVSINESKELDEFLVYLKNYDYFDKDFNDHLPNNLSRFKFAEFVDELNQILKNNNEKQIALVFSDEKYKSLRELWKFTPQELSKKSSFEDKKLFLEQFKTFLILYNQ